jgi:ATP-dependent Clp protease ATP-binding subunit ClpA
LTAGVVLKGELETRVASIYTGLKDSGQTILVIPDLQRICSSDNSLQGEVLNAIKPMFRNAYVKIIGTMTYEDFRKAYEKDDVFETSFYKLPIEELSLNDTKKIVKNFKKSYEKYFGCEYSDDSLEAIVDCAKRFMSNRQFPEKALDIMDMVGAASKYTGNATVTESTVYQTVSTMLNLPLQNISKKECDLYKSLAENLGKEIIGQEEAITKVSDAVIVARSGLRESNKTAISLLFTGSSGCGKSELCRVLARLMNLPLVRFDMSEYMEEHSVSKLLGAPPGYKDSGNGKAGNGLLINEIEEHPNCILMLDEIEKAHPKVHNLLLQVMDNGQLTSSIGKSVSFENVFLIMTSNVGSKVAHKTNIGFMDNGNKPSTEEYDETFLPEFRSRLDATVVFNNLSDNVLRDISKKFLGELTQILKEKHIKFNYNENVLGYIVDKVKAINNGARPIKHIITNEIKNVIAKDIVFGKYVNGGNIMVELENEKLSFKG